MSRWKPGTAWACSLSQPSSACLIELEDLARSRSPRSRRRRCTRPNARWASAARFVEQVGQVLGLDRRPRVAEQRAELADRGRRRSRTACRASRRSPAACRAPPSARGAAPGRSGAGSRARISTVGALDGLAAQRVVVQDLLGEVPDRRDLGALEQRLGDVGDGRADELDARGRRSTSTNARDVGEQRVDVAARRSRRCRRCPRSDRELGPGARRCRRWMRASVRLCARGPRR